MEKSLHSPAAGRLASNRMEMRTANTVGGISIGVPMDAEATNRNFLANAKKDFTGRICQLSAGNGSDVLYVSALIFVPGSIQFMGARTADAIRITAHEMVGRLRRNGLPAEIRHFSIDNRVMTSSLEITVDLAGLHMNMPGYLTSYCPDLFPGLVCGSLSEDVVTFMIFEGGKVMALGVNDVERIKEKFWEIYAMAQCHKIDANVSKQSNKSHERSIRKASRGKPSDKENTIVADTMKAFIAQHRGQMHDTEFSQRMQDMVNEEIRKAIAANREKKKKEDQDLLEAEALAKDGLPAPATKAKKRAGAAPGPARKRVYKPRQKKKAAPVEPVKDEESADSLSTDEGYDYTTAGAYYDDVTD